MSEPYELSNEEWQDIVVLLSREDIVKIDFREDIVKVDYEWSYKFKQAYDSNYGYPKRLHKTVMDITSAYPECVSMVMELFIVDMRHELFPYWIDFGDATPESIATTMDEVRKAAGRVK